MMPIAPGRDDQASLARGLAFARGLSCHLDAVFVRPDPQATFFYGGMAPDVQDQVLSDMRARMEHDGRRAADRARRMFSRLRKKTGIAAARKPGPSPQPTASLHAVKGEALQLVPALARGADATLFTPATAKYSRVSENLFEAALLRTGRPVFYLPETDTEPVLSRVLIAWDGSSACLRAISAWLGSGIALDHAAIVHVAEPHEEHPETAQVAAHLAWHGVRCEVATPQRGAKPIGKILAEAADRLHCGMIVMGGYGHFRNWEAVFGGVTRYMIRHAPLPILMMH